MKWGNVNVQVFDPFILYSNYILVFAHICLIITVIIEAIYIAFEFGKSPVVVIEGPISGNNTPIGTKMFNIEDDQVV